MNETHGLVQEKRNSGAITHRYCNILCLTEH